MGPLLVLGLHLALVALGFVPLWLAFLVLCLGMESGILGLRV
jgi:hypothetical protein